MITFQYSMTKPSFVVIANKDDLASIQLIDESKKTGIYILLGGDKRYIGQASNAIFNRLQQLLNKLALMGVLLTLLGPISGN